MLKSSFGFSSETEEIYYLYKDGDIIAICECPQFTIFYGKINKNNNIYDIEYLLDYEYKFKLLEELKKIN